MRKHFNSSLRLMPATMFTALLMAIGSLPVYAMDDAVDCQDSAADAETATEIDDSLSNVDSHLDVAALDAKSITLKRGYYWEFADMKKASFCLLIMPSFKETKFPQASLCFRGLSVQQMEKRGIRGGQGWAQSHYSAVDGYSIQGGMASIGFVEDRLELNLKWDTVRQDAMRGEMRLQVSLDRGKLTFKGKNVSPFRLGIRICGPHSKSRCLVEEP